MSLAHFRWPTFASALTALLLASAILWSQFPPTYLTNDDVSIRLGIEGRLVPGQPPTGFVLMTHSALAWTLAWLQPLAAGLPLWDVTIVGALAIGLATMAALVWSAAGRTWLTRGASACACAALILPLLTGVQFTVSAAVAAAAAVALAFTEIDSGQRRVGVVMLAGGLLILGVLIRPMAGLAAAVLMAALLMPLALAGASGRIRRAATLAAVMLAAVVSYGVLQYADARLYAREPAWDAYHRYNWIIAQWFEWGGDLLSEDIATMRAAAAWSPNDWSLLAGSFGVEPMHALDRVERAQAARVTPADPVSTLRWLAGRLSTVSGAEILGLVTSMPVALAAILSGVLASGRARHALAAAAAVAIFVAFCAAIQVAFKSLPFRLFAPFELCLVAAVLLIAGAGRRRPPAVMAVAALSLGLTLAIGQARGTIATLRAESAHAQQVAREVGELRALSPTLVILHTDAFPSEDWWRPLRPSPSWPAAIRLGANNQNPQLQRFVAAAGRRPLLRNACDDPSVFIIAAADRLAPLTAYLGEHAQLEATWDEVYSGSFTAWRCAAAPARVPIPAATPG